MTPAEKAGECVLVERITMSIAGERHLLAQGQDAAQTTTVDVLTTLDAPFDVETPYEFDI